MVEQNHLLKFMPNAVVAFVVVISIVPTFPEALMLCLFILFLFIYPHSYYYYPPSIIIVIFVCVYE